MFICNHLLNIHKSRQFTALKTALDLRYVFALTQVDLFHKILQLEAISQPLCYHSFSLIHSQISNLTSSISNFQSQISNLKSQIFTLTSQISNLKSQIFTFKSQISNIQSEISHLLSSISNLHSQISNLQSQIVSNPLLTV